MGLFEEAGRRVERFKKAAEAAAAENADYRCTACEELVFSEREHETCPECGEAELVAVEGEETDADGEETS
jgi:rRNA maturation endonuclease Nob1